MKIQVSMQKENNCDYILPLSGTELEIQQNRKLHIIFIPKYNVIAYPLLLDLRPRFWHSLCT